MSETTNAPKKGHWALSFVGKFLGFVQDKPVWAMSTGIALLCTLQLVSLVTLGAWTFGWPNVLTYGSLMAILVILMKSDRVAEGIVKKWTMFDSKAGRAFIGGALYVVATGLFFVGFDEILDVHRFLFFGLLLGLPFLAWFVMTKLKQTTLLNGHLWARKLLVNVSVALLLLYVVFPASTLRFHEIKVNLSDDVKKAEELTYLVSGTEGGKEATFWLQDEPRHGQIDPSDVHTSILKWIKDNEGNDDATMGAWTVGWEGRFFSKRHARIIEIFPMQNEDGSQVGAFSLTVLLSFFLPAVLFLAYVGVGLWLVDPKKGSAEAIRAARNAGAAAA